MINQFELTITIANNRDIYRLTHVQLQLLPQLEHQWPWTPIAEAVNSKQSARETPVLALNPAVTAQFDRYRNQLNDS